MVLLRPCSVRDDPDLTGSAQGFPAYLMILGGYVLLEIELKSTAYMQVH